MGKSWLVGCFGFTGPLRQYFSLYRAVWEKVKIIYFLKTIAALGLTVAWNI